MTLNTAHKTAPKRQLSDVVADDHHEGNAHKGQRCFQGNETEIVPSPELSNDNGDLATSPANGKMPKVIAGKSSAIITSDESSAVWALLALANFASRDHAKSPAVDKGSKVKAGKSSAIITSDESSAAWALLALAKFASRDLDKSAAVGKRSKVKAGKSSAIFTSDESSAVWALFDLAKGESRDLGDKNTWNSFSK